MPHTRLLRRASREGRIERLGERPEAPGDVLADVDPYHPPPRVAEGVRIADGLGAFNTPNEYPLPGIGRSGTSVGVICKKSPVSGPPLCSCPVECRKRGPNPMVTGMPSPRAACRKALEEGGVFGAPLDVAWRAHTPGRAPPKNAARYSRHVVRAGRRAVQGQRALGEEGRPSESDCVSS